MTTMTGTTTSGSAGPGTTRSGRRQVPRVWAGYAGAAWSLAYLSIVHLPIVLLGHPLTPWPDDPTPGAGPDLIAEAGVIVLLLGTAGTGLALARPWGRVFPRWMLLGVAWTGAAVGFAHWVLWSLQSVQRLAGAFDVPAPRGVSGAEWSSYVQAYDLVNLTIYEPWFLGMAFCLGLGALQNIRRRRALRATGSGAGGTIGGADLRQPPPAWMTAHGWPKYAAVAWTLGALALQGFWAYSLDHPVLRIGAAIGLGLAASVPVLVAMRPGLVLRIVSGILTLGGLVVVLAGIMSFAPWVFAVAGPGLMAGGVLLELTRWSAEPRATEPEQPA